MRVPALDGAHPGSSRLAWWSAFALLVAGLLAPVLAVPVPPLTDYPNHLARCFFLAFGATDPVLRHMLVADWAITPNLAMDVITPPLMHLMPPLVAGRVVIALAILLPATGTIALHRAIWRRRSWWPLGVGLVCYNTLFLLGTLNFQISAGVALWGAACWVVMRRRGAALAVPVGACFALLCFVCHLFGCGFFLLLIATHELASMAPLRLAALQARRAIAVGLVALVPIALLMLSPLARAQGRVHWPSLGQKLMMLLIPVLAYTPWSSVVLAVVLVGLIASWWRHHRLAIAPVARFAVPLLLAAYAVLPIAAKGAYWVDARVPVLLGFGVFAWIMPHGLSNSTRHLTGLAFAAAFAWRMAAITQFWIAEQPDIAAVRGVLGPIPPGSRVLVVDGAVHRRIWFGWGSTPHGVGTHAFGVDYLHYGAFALIDRRAMWSDMFTLPGQQPVRALPPYDLAGDRGLRMPRPITALATAVAAPPSQHPDLFMNAWPGKFDYVLVLGAPAAPALDQVFPRTLTLLGQQRLAALYEVRPATADGVPATH